LNLTLIGAGADDKKIRKRSDAGEIEYLDVRCLFRFGGSDGKKPSGR
jgi:hypothetical protein